jgi:hypothetical protein
MPNNYNTHGRGYFPNVGALTPNTNTTEITDPSEVKPGTYYACHLHKLAYNYFSNQEIYNIDTINDRYSNVDILYKHKLYQFAKTYFQNKMNFTESFVVIDNDVNQLVIVGLEELLNQPYLPFFYRVRDFNTEIIPRDILLSRLPVLIMEVGAAQTITLLSTTNELSDLNNRLRDFNNRLNELPIDDLRRNIMSLLFPDNPVFPIQNMQIAINNNPPNNYPNNGGLIGGRKLKVNVKKSKKHNKTKKNNKRKSINKNKKSKKHQKK